LSKTWQNASRLEMNEILFRSVRVCLVKVTSFTCLAHAWEVAGELPSV